MAKAKKNVATPKNPRSRTVYAYWPDPDINDEMLCNLLDNFHNDASTAKEEAVADDCSEAYIYQVTVTRIAKGHQPPFSWTKE